MTHGDPSVRDPSVGLDDLLAHREWVRALALSLTRDENEAADVEQQTWLAAMRAPPVQPNSVRGWLGTVVRRAVYRRHRASTRRRARESDVARADVARSEDGPAALAERADAHARVAAAVVALREPYRQAILLRYFEGESVGDVARRMGTPHETARARLRRGREMLRGALAGTDSGGVVLVLAPLLVAPRCASAGTVAVATGGVLMTGKIIAGTVAVLLLAAGGWWITRDTERADTGATETAVAPPPRSPPLDVDPPPEARPERARVQPPAPVHVAETPAPEEPKEPDADRPPQPSLDERLAAPVSFEFEGERLRYVLGRISDMSQVPMFADGTIAASLDTIPLTLQLNDVPLRDALNVLAMISGARIEIEAERVVLHSAGSSTDPGAAAGEPVRIEPIALDPDAPTTITVRGRVLDERSAPVPGARVVSGTMELAVVGTDGRFEFESKSRTLQLAAEAPFFVRAAPWVARGELGDVLEHDFTLGPPAGGVEVIVTSDGNPVVGAQVLLGPSSPAPGSSRPFGGRTDDAGRYEDRGVPLGDVRVIVTKKGHSREERAVVSRTGLVARVEIVLRAVALADRLRDERISFTFEGTSVTDALQFVRARTGMNVVWSPALGVALHDTKVSVTVADDSIENALRALCDAVGDWTVRVEEERNLVWIEPRER